MAKCVIPGNVSAIVGAASSEEMMRFGATTGIQLTIKEDGSYRACATDGRIAAIIKGVGEKTLGVGDLVADPKAETAVINAKDFGTILEEVRAAEFSIGEAISVMGSRTGGGFVTIESSNVEGRFPDVDGVIPKTPPAATGLIDARRLIQLLKVAAEIQDEYGHCGTTIEIHGQTGQYGDKPAGTASAYIVLRVKNETGQEFTGVLVQMDKHKT